MFSLNISGIIYIFREHWIQANRWWGFPAMRSDLHLQWMRPELFLVLHHAIWCGPQERSRCCERADENIICKSAYSHKYLYIHRILNISFSSSIFIFKGAFLYVFKHSRRDKVWLRSVTRQTEIMEMKVTELYMCETATPFKYATGLFVPPYLATRGITSHKHDRRSLSSLRQVYTRVK